MGISLRVDNDDIPWGEKLEAERHYGEIIRLQSMAGILHYENGGNPYIRKYVNHNGRGTL
ncbi:MAG: hypothetical protein KAT37_01155 [Candidatus Aenigmarchaeota archaeon]|nr:hypothetical protein [Candidatus Aenigmarchaeota archaeon]